MMGEYHRLGVSGNYFGNRIRRTYPAGMEAEITSADNLREAYLMTSRFADFADPTAILRRGELPQCRSVDFVQSVDQSRWRFRLDTLADHQRLSRLLGLVQKYSLQEVMTVAEAHGLLSEDDGSK
jgi:spore coat polysaccharide biosynthesis protein SpsF (cytidylyltransferase family)